MDHGRRLQALGPAHLAALHAQVEAQRAKRLVELDHAGGQPGPPCAASGDLAATVEQELAAWRQHIAAMADSVQIATTRYPSPDHDPVARRHAPTRRCLSGSTATSCGPASLERIPMTQCPMPGSES
jgi:hypothetical protein